MRPKLGGQAHQWTGLIPALNGRWYWPGSTIVDNNTPFVFAYIVGPGSRAPPFNFTIHGTAVIKYNLRDLALQSATNLPVNNAPRPVYNGGLIPWGIRCLRSADGTVNLYGRTKRSNLGSADVQVAKAPLAQVTDESTWQYSTGVPRRCRDGGPEPGTDRVRRPRRADDRGRMDRRLQREGRPAQQRHVRRYRGSSRL